MQQRRLGLLNVIDKAHSMQISACRVVRWQIRFSPGKMEGLVGVSFVVWKLKPPKFTNLNGLPESGDRGKERPASRPWGGRRPVQWASCVILSSRSFQALLSISTPIRLRTACFAGRRNLASPRSPFSTSPCVDAHACELARGSPSATAGGPLNNLGVLAYHPSGIIHFYVSGPGHAQPRV